MKRYAIVKNARDRAQVEAYLPDNYKIVHEYLGSRYSVDDKFYDQGGENGMLGFVIVGEDKAGWTLDDYVIPRLGSGLIIATEIDRSHPLMHLIPEEEIVG